MPYYIGPPPQNPLTRIIATIIAALMLVGAFMLGLVALLILGGVAYFGLASLGAALSAGLPMLIFFRVQQAMAIALAMPNGTALIR